MSLIAEVPLVVVDVETTGWSVSEGHELIEIARIEVRDGAVGAGWSSLVKPDHAIPPDATRIHGIRDAMVADAPKPADVAATFHAGCRDRTLVFHHAAFDLPFVNAFLRRGGLAPLYNPVIDTLGLARGLFGSGSNALGELTERLGLPRQELHRAEADARATAQLLLALAPRWERERGVRSVDELAAASQDAIRVLALRG